MNNKFFCEVVRDNDPVIKFQMVEANQLKDVINSLKKKYIDIKEVIIKDMKTLTIHIVDI